MPKIFPAPEVIDRAAQIGREIAADAAAGRIQREYPMYDPRIAAARTHDGRSQSVFEDAARHAYEWYLRAVDWTRDATDESDDDELLESFVALYGRAPTLDDRDRGVLEMCLAILPK